jgi:cellulose synthase operon protein C
MVAQTRSSAQRCTLDRMHGSQPSLPDDETELTDDDIIAGDRASILAAAANARSVAMLTGTHGVVVPPLDKAALRMPEPRAFAPEPEAWEPASGAAPLAACLEARIATLASGDDPVGLVRARLELAALELDGGNLAAARVHAEAAAGLECPTPAVDSLLRRLVAGRAEVDLQRALVDRLSAAAAEGSVAADYLAERGRLLESAGGPSEQSVEAFGEALRLCRDHAAALYGLEVALDSTGKWPALAAHLAHVAELASAREESAWLHVERGLILDRRERDREGARAALARALSQSKGLGPVRDACVDHAVLHRDDAQLARLLEEEAGLEGDPARAARLELDAALAHLRAGGDAAHAVKLLERAHGRAPTGALVDARIAHELARLHDLQGAAAEALRVRKAAVRGEDDPLEERLLLRAVATSAERAGAIDDAVLALERARMLDGDDPTLLADLDRLLVSAERHEARAILWMRESARLDDPARKARSLLVAAAASRAAGKDADAARHLQSAWVAAPAAPGVYDALAERIGAAGAEPAVAARVALYEQAVRATPDPDRRVYFLERIAWLWDDVAGDPARAAAAYEDVLAVEPARTSAIAGLASSAARAGDAGRLSRGLLAEAGITADPPRRAELRLRAAESMAEVDPDRALALADELARDETVGPRAEELVTRLHATSGRWELVAQVLGARRRGAPNKSVTTALALAEVDVLLGRLAAPERALEALAEARAAAPGDAVLAYATLAALEALGDDVRTLEEIEKLVADTKTPRSRAALLVRAAEIEEARPGGDARALRYYERALEALPEEPFVSERLARLGARCPEVAGAHGISPLTRAVRGLEGAEERNLAEALLSSPVRSFATLRVAERLARRAQSAPQLANALAMQADGAQGVASMRALSGLASLVAWVLPESEDLEPWDRLVALGSRDVTVLDALSRRAWAEARSGDTRALELAREARRRALEVASDDTERLLARLDLARLARHASRPRDAAEHGRAALALEPRSVTAALFLGEASVATGDRAGALAAASALAELATDRAARSDLLRDAADLAAADGDKRAAVSLLERALDANPESVLVAARLAQLGAEIGAFSDLARALTRALPRATTAEAVVPMASELADIARNKLHDPLLAIEALERARAVAPDHVPTLFLLAELAIAQRSWDKALEALGEVVVNTREGGEKLVALIGRASIFSRVLGDQSAAERELRAALEIEPHDVRALRSLLDLGVELSREERAALLSRLALAETRPRERIAALLELAVVRKQLGDFLGVEGALVEAAAASPDPAMIERVREITGGDADAFARVVTRAVARARESGQAASPAWLARLGQIEADVLGKHDEAIGHLRDALVADPSRVELRPVLAQVLVSTARSEEAVFELLPLLESRAAVSHLDASALRLLEVAFTGSGRQVQALVARELRAVAGAIDARERAALEGRRGAGVDSPDALSRPALRGFVMPVVGRHPVWDVAPIAVELAGKLARVSLADLGASTRDRVKPRATHPLRGAFDRALRTFGLSNVELAVSEGASRSGIAVEDGLWFVLPSGLSDRSDRVLDAVLGKLAARAAVGVPWIDGVPLSEAFAMILAVARQVSPSVSVAPGNDLEPLIADYELRARRAIDRKKRRALEDLAGALESAPPLATEAFAEAVLRTEARAAFAYSGDLRAALSAACGLDGGGLGAVADSSVARDLVVWALGADATALRRGLGSVWT